MKQHNSGTLYGIGVGPGDPELLTLKALRVLQESDLIIAPRTASGKESTALNIVTKAFEEYRLGTSKLPQVDYITFPMKNNGINTEKLNQEIDSKIISGLTCGQKISFITLGDPLLYSTYRRLKERASEIENITIEHIPGIYSFSAIASRLGRDLTYGKDKLAVIPVEKNNNYEKELTNYDTVVFLKVSANLYGLIQQLSDTRRLTDAVLVEKVGMHDERIYEDLEQFVDANSQPDFKMVNSINYLSTIIVFS